MIITPNFVVLDISFSSPKLGITRYLPEAKIWVFIVLHLNSTNSIDVVEGKMTPNDYRYLDSLGRKRELN